MVLMPRRLATGIGAWSGLLLFSLLRRERNLAIDNIRDSLSYFGQHHDWDTATVLPAEIARRTFANMGRSFSEVLKLYCGLGNAIINGVTIRGWEHFIAARDKGKGVIFATGHCGNWELMAIAFGVRHVPVSVVARRQRHEFVNEMFERLRRRFGNSVIYASGAARRAFSTLRTGGIVGILIDQVVPPEGGCLIEFLGRRAWVTTMPALIAAKTLSPILPIFIHREGGEHVITIHPAIEVTRDTEGNPDIIRVTDLMTKAIEIQIAAHPDEWLWMYKRWKNVP
jgi:KDO2-lipid IV(A) lauroyltransferase